MDTPLRAPTNLEIELVGEVLSIARWIESMPDDELDPDTGVKMLEDLAGVVGELGQEDQQTFIRAARHLADRRPDDWNAAAIERMLVDFGLMEPSGELENVDGNDPPPPLPPDLDDRVASIHSALERYVNGDPGEPTGAGGDPVRRLKFVQRVRRLLRSRENPDA
jgi:hypothetical protein